MIESNLELVDLFKRASERSTLSQIYLPFCSDPQGERPPIALLSGNINLKRSLQSNGNLVSLQEALSQLENDAILSGKTKGQVIDLSEEIKKLNVSSDISEKELEIKEEWTIEDEKIFSASKERIGATPIAQIIPLSSASSKIPDDIEIMLRLAEEEEKELVDEKAILGSRSNSKIKEIKNELLEQNYKPKSNVILSKLNLPKCVSSNPLVGDIVEHSPERASSFNNGPVSDDVSTRVIINQLKQSDLQKDLSDDSAIFKKSSRFSLRKQ